MRYFRFDDHHFGFSTCAHIAQCSSCYSRVPHGRKHGFSRCNLNSISSTNSYMRYYRFCGRHLGFLTSAQTTQCLYCFCRVSEPGLWAAIYNFRLLVFQKIHIYSARPDTCSSKLLDVRTVDCYHIS